MHIQIFQENRNGRSKTKMITSWFAVKRNEKKNQSKLKYAFYSLFDFIFSLNSSDSENFQIWILLKFYPENHFPNWINEHLAV